MWNTIVKLRLPVLLALIGALLTLSSTLTGLSVSDFNPEPRASISIPLLVLGLLFLFAAAIPFLLERELLPGFGLRAVRRTSDGLTACIGRTRITVHFGRLENKVPAPSAGESQLVLLPTNEFFDDDCFDAGSTACGAFLRAKIPDRMVELKQQILAVRAACTPIGQFEKEVGKLEASYGAGTCLFLNHPVALPHALLLAAVATKRAGAGFQSNPAHVFQCIEQMSVVATDNRITSVLLPLIGAGKGGLTPEASLMTILLSLSTMQRRLGGFDSTIHVVIFQRDAEAKPSIDRKSAAQILNLAALMHRRDAATS